MSAVGVLKILGLGPRLDFERPRRRRFGPPPPPTFHKQRQWGKNFTGELQDGAWKAQPPGSQTAAVSPTWDEPKVKNGRQEIGGVVRERHNGVARVQRP